MDIDSIQDLGAELEKRCRDAGFKIQGPQHFEWGYGWSPNITFWAGDRRVHFFFEGMHGRVYVIVEAAEVGPPRKAVVSRIQDVDEAFLILNQFLRKRCDFADLPGDEWLSNVPTHDEQIPHPPGEGGEAQPEAPRAPRPEARISPVGTMPSAPRPQAARAAGVAGVGGVVLFSNDAPALARWYRDMLGVPLQEQGGQYLGRLGNLQFGIQSSETPIASGTRPVMLSYAVSSFDTFVADLAGRGAEFLGLDESKAGKFAYVRDTDGNPVEIWGPPGS